MVYRIACWAVLGMLLFSVPSAKADVDKEDAAISGALKWLTMIDEGKYADSWNDAADFFKDAVGKEQWVQSLRAVRKPLGKLLSREPMHASYQTSLPGAPDGQYVVIQFKASFENKKSAIETVTPMLGKDGNWKVSGYYIK